MHHSAVYHVMQRGKYTDFNNLLTMGYTFYPDDLAVAVESGNTVISQALLHTYPDYKIGLESAVASQSVSMITLALANDDKTDQLISLIARRHDLVSLHIPAVLEVFNDLPVQFINQNFTEGVKLLLETRLDNISPDSIRAGFELAVKSGSLSMVKIFLEKTPDIITKLDIAVDKNTRLHHILTERQLI